MQEMSFYLKQLEEQGRSTELYSLVAVSNLPTDCTETLLWTIYGQFGAIESLVMPQYPNGACRGMQTFCQLLWCYGKSVSDLSLSTPSGAPILKIFFLCYQALTNR